MARAIDAENTMNKLLYGDAYISEELAKYIKQVFDEQPTIEAESVKHCKWVFAPDTGPFGRGTWVCSGCGKPNHNILVMALSDPNTGVTYRRAPYTFDGHQFCPNCGASMDD